MTSTHRSPVRWLAPVALLVCALAVVLVVTGSSGGGAGGSSTKTEQRSTGTSSNRSTSKRSRKGKGRRTYRVRAGDTLGAIAQRTGVPLSELQALNPKLDAQALQTGQKVKLRP